MAVVTPMMMNEELSLCLVVLVVVDDELTQSRCDFCDEYQGCHYHRKFNKLRYQFHSTQTNFSCGRALVHLPQVTVKIRAECKRTISQKHHEKTRFPFLFPSPTPRGIFTMAKKHDKGTHFKNGQSSEQICANVNHVV